MSKYDESVHNLCKTYAYCYGFGGGNFCRIIIKFKTKN